MVKKRIDKFLNDINEHFSSVWVLLSDTTIFLSNHTKIFHHYENALRDIRHRLELSRNDIEEIREIRQEIAEIRKSLRLQGYNLKLGTLDLRTEGFRNDDAISKGFRRCVLFLMEDGDVLYITGESNHIDLESALDSRLNATGYKPLIGKHYLWYKWTNRVLILSGAATETVNDFEVFKEYVLDNKENLLKKLRKI